MKAVRWTYRCTECGTEYAIEPGRYLCDRCASGRDASKPLKGLLECRWHGRFEGTPDDIPLPVGHEYLPKLPVGGTPLWQPERLRDRTSHHHVFLKDDTCEPSASFKDRASWLVAGFAQSRGIGEICLASTGNAASSMACIGAAAGLHVTVFLPKTAPAAKRVQVLQYGADLREVNGTYDQAYELSLDHSQKTGALSRNTAYNPLTIEGKKTAAFEIVRDLAKAYVFDEHGAKIESVHEFIAPNHVFVPAGDGTILSGVYKGFEDLVRLGRIDDVPTIWACQAEGSSAIARAFETGTFGPAVRSTTLADSIAVDVPRAGNLALAYLKKYRGRAIVLSDSEILEAQRALASGSGLFAEPSSATAWAGFEKARAIIGEEEIVVVMVTGSGLKDVGGAMRALGL